MAMFLLRRLGLMVLTLWILSLIVFFAGQILPGDPGRATLGQFGADAGDALGVAVGQADHRAADHVGRGRVTLGDPVVEDQAVVEPLAFGRVEQVRLTLADPRGQAVHRLAGGENILDDRAGLAHADDRLRRQRDGFTVPGGRHDLRNSQVTSIEADRHSMLTHL